jgi:glutamyl/glutaminyl-tRNA synthetase
MLQGDSHSTLGDVVLWTKENSPAYQLVSIVTDRDLGTTHILRGQDLAQSSALQINIAPFFAAENVAQAVYLHHELVVDNSGTKLAKSAGAQGRPLVISRDVLDTWNRLAAEIGTTVGITPPLLQPDNE